jgi:hypothetical protein
MPARPEKSRLTVECTLEEKTYIKMLATKSHKTISEFLLSYVRPDLPITEKKKPNKETLKVMQDIEEGKDVISCDSMDDFWEELGVKPSAED